MMVVIVIISIVASIGSNTFSEQRKQVKYNDSVLQLIQMIKTARNYAVTSRSYWDGTNNVVPPEGYGVYIEKGANPGESRAILFANRLADTDFTRNQYDAGPGGDLIEEEYYLPPETDLVGIFTGLADPPTVPVNVPLGSFTNAIETKAVIIFRPPLAEATVAANDNPAPNPITFENDLYFEFRRQGSLVGIPSTYIHINRVAGFPETL